MVGNDIKASVSGVDTAGATLIMNDMILNEGVVFAYSAYFRSDKPVRFQIWRPLVNGSKNAYRLVGETRVIPSLKNGREDVSICNHLSTVVPGYSSMQCYVYLCNTLSSAIQQTILTNRDGLLKMSMHTYNEIWQDEQVV